MVLEEDGREDVGEVVWIILVTVWKRQLRCLGLCAVLGTRVADFRRDWCCVPGWTAKPAISRFDSQRRYSTLALSSFKSLWQFNMTVTIHFRVKDGKITYSASKDHHHRSEDSLLVDSQSPSAWLSVLYFLSVGYQIDLRCDGFDMTLGQGRSVVQYCISHSHSHSDNEVWWFAELPVLVRSTSTVVQLPAPHPQSLTRTCIEHGWNNMLFTHH